MKAVVRGGRAVLVEDRVDYPDGTELQLYFCEPVDELDEEELAHLDAALEAGQREYEATGKTYTASEGARYGRPSEGMAQGLYKAVTDRDRPLERSADMVTGALVDRYVDAGRKFVNYLDAEGVEAPTALWLYRNDRNYWKLILSVPQAETELLEAVHRVLDVFSRHEADLAPLRFDDIAVKPPSDQLMRALREKVQIAPAGAEVRVTGSPVGGVWVEDALLYRAR